jgi:hypothetical protein
MLTSEILNIIKAHKVQDEINKAFKSNKNYGFYYDIDTFSIMCYNLSPQRYGLRMQDYFGYMLNFKKVPSKKDRGDYLSTTGQFVEFKCSFLKEYQREINVKQIRLYQDLSYYLVFTVDYSDYFNIKYKTYMLSKLEMEQECILMNATSCHMTKENHEQNEKVELGFTIREDSENFKRWEEKYLLKRFDIVEVCDKKLDAIFNSLVKDNLIKDLQLQKGE